MQISGLIIVSMKTIIFILAISALTTPIFSATCTNPITGCSTCETGGTTCNKAAAGYFLMGDNKTPTLCSGGKGKGEDAAPAAGADAAATATTRDAACTVTCTGGCEACTTAASCLNCKAGYWYSAANTCSWCTGNKGAAVDTDVIANAESESTACGVTCTATNCLACGAEADKAKCLACDKGRTPNSSGVCDICGKDTYWTATNMCTACPGGKTRPAPTNAASAVEPDTVCTAAASSATLIQALCGASVAAYALF